MKKRKILRERRRRIKVLSAVVALVLVAAMGVGVFMNSGTQVYAADRQADGDTSGTYNTVLGESSSTRYDGRVWVDKSVNTGNVTFTGENLPNGSVTVENDSDSSFLVTYSALSTSTQVEGESNVPVDVVFIIDNSSSMINNYTWSGYQRVTYLQATVNAVNESISELMAMNDQNRVSVVLFGATSDTLLPLGHYTSAVQSGDIYIQINSVSSNNSSFSTTVRETNQTVNMNTNNGRGTNIQAGVYEGMNILATEDETTATVGNQQVSRVPAVILLSDGAATYSSSSENWWAPANNGNDGPGSSAYAGNGMKAMMTAAYMKQAINRNYGVEDTSSAYAAKVYTIGMGITSLSNYEGSGNRRRYTGESHLAYLTLDPSNDSNWTGYDNEIASAISGAWQAYCQGQTSRVEVNNNDYYTFSHPQTNDIADDVDAIRYNDGYYDAGEANDVTQVFEDILSQISISTPTVPTLVSGDDPTTDGYITYTDTTGQYMEVKDVKTLIWSDVVFTRASSSTTGNVTTYVFEGTINSPAYGEHNAREIIITVTDNDDHTQTITVQIPASAIPLRVNTVSLDNDGNVESNVSNNAMPLRLVYSVGLEEGVDPDTLENVSDEYIAANTVDGKVNFYSNAYTAADDESSTEEQIGAQVTFTPALTNPFYYFQEDTPIYTDESGQNQATSFDENATYYIPVTYYSGTREVTVYVPRSGADLANYIDSEHIDGEYWWQEGYDLYFIRSGSPRLGNLADFTASKEQNSTGTASTYREPQYITDSDDNSAFVVYLGNNGRLQLDAPASLIITKQVTADEGLTAPGGTFTFQITAEEKAGQTVSAVLTTPAAGEGGQAGTLDTTVVFDEDGMATVELTAGQSIELQGMAGVDYEIRETELPKGFSTSNIEGADEVDSDTHTASGTIAVGADDESVTFINNYSVTSTTTADLGIDLDGTKTIDGRDFQEGDTFTFQIAAAQATPDAPLPTKDTDNDGSVTTVTINPSSGNSVSFKFGDITFTEPGEYRYIITEVNPTDDGDDATSGIPGMAYDTVLYRMNIVIVDKGDGTLGLLEVSGENPYTSNLVTNNPLVYTSNPMLQVYTDGSMQSADEVAFENTFSATEATAAIRGTKTLNVTDSDREMGDGEFKFTITALGSNTDGGDEFTADGTQPMPDTRTVSNITNGDVIFGSGTDVMTFTQNMVGKTYGYQIAEDIPEDAQDNGDGTYTLNGVTYQQNVQTVKITVGLDDDNVTATVTPNTNGVNFAFTNSYEPTSTTIGGDSGNAGITVQKTFTGRGWTDDYSFTFDIEAVSNTAGIEVSEMPMPKNSLTIEKPESGTVNTGTFGEMTFEKAGTYVYEVTEQNTGHGGVTYDIHVATVTVTVTEDGAKGSLSSSVSYDNSQATTEGDQGVTGAAAFTNTYSADDTAFSLTGTKNVDVADGFTYTLNNGSFYFEITPLDGAPAAATPVGNTDSTQVEGSNDWTSKITLMDNLTFRLSDLEGAASRDFAYIITEQSASRPGVGYDTSAYRVVITVTDDGEGKLSVPNTAIDKGIWDAASSTFTPAAGGNAADTIVFTNTYAPESITTAPLEITKTLTGADLGEGDYSFTISIVTAEPQDGAALPEQMTVSNDVDGKVQFGDITFSKPGTYVIAASENIPDNATNTEVTDDDGNPIVYANASDEQKAMTGWTLDGVTYDTHTIQSTFTVTDNNGTLTAVRSGTTGSQTFANTYGATGSLSGAANLEVTKVIDGRGFQAGDGFTFTLTGGDADTLQAIEDEKVILPDNADDLTISYADGDDTNKKSVAFGDITFTAAGSYAFNITETVPDSAVNLSVNNGATTYENATDEQKAMAGWTLGGVTYDNSPHQVTVSVTDEGDGTLTAVVTGNTGNPTITNRYEPAGDAVLGSGSISLTKVLKGKDWDGDSFQFTISGVSAQTPDGTSITDIPLPAERTVTVGEATDVDEDGNDTADITFGNITFNTIGTYTYEVREVVPKSGDDNYNAGMKYSENVATIVVSVTDGLDGTLHVAVTSQQNTTFTNEYGTELDYRGAGGLAIVKNLTGADIEADEFTFTVTPVDAASAAKLGIPEAGQTYTTAGADMTGEGTASESITLLAGETAFTQEDAGTSYTYTVSEQNGGTTVDGVTYDGTTYTVTITTTDDGQGGITVTTTVAGSDGSSKTYTYNNDEEKDEQAVIPFNNTYSASGTLGGDGNVSIKASKSIQNADIADYEGDFSFNVTAANGTDTKTYATAVNAADGSITFPAIAFSTESLMDDAENGYASQGKNAAGNYTYTYSFAVSEVTTGLPAGVTSSVGSFTVGVVVTDNGDGTLDIAVNYPQGYENGLAFVNTYGASASAEIQVGGRKDYSVQSGATNAPDITGQFTFTLTGTDNAGNTAPLPDTTETTNESSGAVSFGNISYDISDMEGAADNGDGTRTKVFTYTVTESGSVTGVINDQTASRTFTVTLTDDGQGNITAVSSETPGAQFTFTNSYNLTPQESSPTGEGGITITKDLEGRGLNEGEFSFEMQGVAGTASEGMRSSGVNAADGTVSMSSVIFNAPGTYQFVIYEADNGLGGVDYDTARYNATAVVSDNGDGTLSVAWSFTDGENDPIEAIAFDNSYSAAPTSVALGAVKSLDGRALKEGEFSFELKDADGNVLQIKQNDAEGAVAFDSITFDQPGTYTYTVSEVKGDDSTITYDETVYTAVITVTDDLSGHLAAEVTDGDGNALSMTFANKYTEPAKEAPADSGPTSTGVRTGDTAAVLPLVIAMAAALVVMLVLGAVILRRRRR